RPVERGRNVVVVAVAARPLGIVGERRAALVIEEAQVVVRARGRQPLDSDVHRVMIAWLPTAPRVPAIPQPPAARRGAYRRRQAHTTAATPTPRNRRAPPAISP